MTSDKQELRIQKTRSRLNGFCFKPSSARFLLVTCRWAIVTALSVLLVQSSIALRTPRQSPKNTRTTSRPNILWILGDDLGPQLGCYGTPLVRTPNIDRLASEGARYTNAFTTAPVCSPSRSALITGMYQTTIGAHDHRSHQDDGYTLPSNVKLLTDHFRKAGYFTANVTTPAPNLKVAGKTDFNFSAPKPFDGTDWSQRAPGQPFYAQVNFYEPHRTPGGYSQQPVRNQKHTVDPAKVRLPPYFPDHQVVRQDWADYLNSIQILDAKVGAVLDRLEREGLADNTIVMFFSDNGQCHIRGKVWLYDAGIHIPLIIRHPKEIKAGTVRDELVSGIDITATTLSLAGISVPPNMHGQVFLGDMARPRKYIFAARDRCGEAVDRVRAVRSARYKLIRNYRPEIPYTQPHNYIETHYPTIGILRQFYKEGRLNTVQSLFMQPRKPAEELYDIIADPYEVNNLAASVRHQAVRNELRQALDEWMRASDRTQH